MPSASNHKEPMFCQHKSRWVQHAQNNSRDAYSTRIRKPHIPSADIEQTECPTFHIKSNSCTFQSNLNLYYQTEAAYKRKYTEMEKTNAFLGAIANDTRYTKATMDVRNLLPREREMHRNTYPAVCASSNHDE